MALTHRPAIVFNSLEDASWVRAKARTLQDTDADRDLAGQVAKLMAEYRQEYAWQAVSVENICIPEIGIPFRMIQIGYEENPCATYGITYVNPSIIDDYQDQDIHPVFGACGSLRNPYFFYLRPRRIIVRGITLEDYLKGDSVLTAICPSGNYYPDVYQHEIEHTIGICISDKGPVAQLYLPHGKHQPPQEMGHFPSEFGSFIHSIFHDATTLGRDSPFAFALAGGCLHYIWEPSLEESAEPDATAELSLVLDFEQAKPYYQLHMATCREIPSRLEYGKPFIFNFPNYPGVSEVLRTSYVDYQKSDPPEPFFRPELKLCDCIEN
jgi:peptide deformylase